jgi:hypothetical protein
MAIRISGYEDFKGKFNLLKHSRNIFLFLLYDSSGGQEAVGRFVEERFMYLDELAGASQTFIFLFTPDELGAGATPNPGLAVAASFRIRPRQLPGVLVFCLAADNKSFGDGAYLPIDESLFQENPNAIEDAFADLFSMIQDSAESEDTPRDQIVSLRTRIERQQRAREMRPLIASLKAGTISVIKFAGELLVAVAPAWAG